MTAAAILLALSVVGLAYTFAGYPACLWLRAALRPRPVRKAPCEPPVAIVIVVHDGEAQIAAKIESCLAQDYPADRLRVVVASDGSADGTEARVKAMGHPRVRLMRLRPRRGKAACLNDAVAACSEPCIVMTDVRQPLDPGAVRALVANLADPQVGVVSGKLVRQGGEAGGYAQGLDAYLRYEQALRRLESRGGSLVGVTGALYAMRRDCFRPIPPDTVLDDMLVPLQAAALGRRIVFEERAVAYETLAADPARERSRKVRTLAGNFQLLARHPWLLLPWRHPVAFELYSHKVARLLGPVLLAVALGANLALAGTHPALDALLAAQLAAYAGAAWAAASPWAGRLRPLGLALAFLSLNAYVVLGAREFLANGKVHLWKPSLVERAADE